MKKMYVVMNVPSTGIFRRPKSNRLVDGDNRSIKVNTMPLYPSRIAAVSAAKQFKYEASTEETKELVEFKFNSGQ